MKTFNVQILVVSILIVSVPLQVQARFAESADSTQYSYQGEKTYWMTLKKSAETKVNQLWSFVKTKYADLTHQPQSDVKNTGPNRAIASLPGQPNDIPAQPPTTAAESTAAVSSTSNVTDATTNHAVAVGGQAAPATQVPAPQPTELSRSAITLPKAVFTVSREGRAPSASLPKLTSGVPVFALTKKEIKKDKKGKKQIIEISVSDLPRLDVGEERSITKNELIMDMEPLLTKIRTKVKSLESPKLTPEKAVLAIKKIKMPLVLAAKKPQHKDVELGQLVSQQRIDKVPLDMTPVRAMENLKNYVEFSNKDLDMVAAVILFEKGEMCHMATGLLTDLASNSEHSEEANFYMGICAHQMGFHSEAVSRLNKVIQSENRDFTSEAISQIVEDLPREHDKAVSTTIKNLKDKSLINPKAADAVNFVLARAAHSNSEYDAAINYASKVSEKSKLYQNARFIYAIGLYAKGRAKEAEEALLQLRTYMGKGGRADKNLEGLIAINLARIRFTEKRYTAAHEEYLKVPKDNPMWVQALIEQGWTQLSIDDPEGAIGNMYSLHSPYFKSVFMPESWVVRTIGYIDICQYGDAYRTLTKLEQSHKAALDAVKHYQSAKKNPLDYYNTVKSYIRGKSDQAVDGLPSQIVREIARQKEFLNDQSALNVLEDEIAQYQFIYGFVKRDQNAVQGKMTRAKARIDKLQASLNAVKTKPETAQMVPEWQNQKRQEEQQMRSLQYQAQIFERARLGYLRMKTMAVARIDGLKGKLKIEAGKSLMSHLSDVNKRLGQILEGNEFLRYEIFSGSGENIRYQVTGGTTTDARRIPANVKPQKILNWEFDGEYWEDEIGSYRSSLKNNCPKHMQTSAR